jgi:hypothetical protein
VLVNKKTHNKAFNHDLCRPANNHEIPRKA